MKATKDHLIPAGRKPGKPGTVTVDGLEFDIVPLSRLQTMQVHEEQQERGLAAAEALLLHLGLLDPAFSLEEATEWIAEPGQAGIVQAVSAAIGKISGMLPQSPKEATKSAAR